MRIRCHCPRCRAGLRVPYWGNFGKPGLECADCHAPLASNAPTLARIAAGVSFPIAIGTYISLLFSNSAWAFVTLTVLIVVCPLMELFVFGALSLLLRPFLRISQR